MYGDNENIIRININQENVGTIYNPSHEGSLHCRELYINDKIDRE